MEQIARRLPPEPRWTYLGGVAQEGAAPVEVVFRVFEGGLLAATGTSPEAPDSTPVPVGVGVGARLTGRHFFVRPAGERDGCLYSYRGL